MRTQQYKNLTTGYIAAGKRERYCMDELASNMSTEKTTYEFKPSPYGIPCSYDGILYKKRNNQIIGISLIEIKVRDTNYPDYILEEYKMKKLFEERNKLKDECMQKYGCELSILYVNFTPTSTVIWNLDELKENNLLNNIETRDMNNITIDSRKKKKDKKVIMLKVSDGMFTTKFIYDTKKYMIFLEMENMNLEELSKNVEETQMDIMDMFKSYRLKKKIYQK